jgi:hypothetical protein
MQMLWDASVIKGFRITGSDGPVGTAIDFLFDDESWRMRWLVVDTGHWFSGREILIPISALGRPDPTLREFSVNLTVRQAKECPDIARDLPVSRQAENDLYVYYGWEPYWAGAYFGGAIAAEFVPPHNRPEMGLQDPDTRNLTDYAGDQHLCSAEDVIGYRVQATDGEVGRVEEFLVEEASWDIRYVKVRAGNWLDRSKVLISPLSVSTIDWIERLVFLDIDRKKVEDSPTYDPLITIDERHEMSPLPYNGINGVLP